MKVVLRTLRILGLGLGKSSSCLRLETKTKPAREEVGYEFTGFQKPSVLEGESGDFMC